MKNLTNPRLFSVFCLGFASGLPIALTSSTLQAWFTQAGMSLALIGWFSLLGLPYALKFLWAPLMDHYAIPFLGKRRGWILLSQLGVVVSLIILSFQLPQHQYVQMGILAVLLAFFSASADIAIDAYRTDVLHAPERGLGAAYFVFSYRIALLVAGGLALICADYVGFRITYQLMAGIMILMMLPAYKAPPIQESMLTSSTFLQLIASSLKELLQREKIVLLFVFIIFYKIGDALALSLMTNFLLHGLGFSLTEVGLAYKTVSFLATISGAFLGGVLLTRWNLYSALMWFGIAQAFSNLTFVLLAMSGKSFILMAGSIFIENFCSGMSTAAFFAFLMSMCDHRYTATQFALLSAIASIGRIFLGPIAALLVQHLGWTQFFIVAFLLCMPGLIILLLLKQKVSDYAHATI